MRVDQAGWLLEDAEGFPAIVKVPSCRTVTFDGSTGNRPLGLVWHWTGGTHTSQVFARALADEIRSFDQMKDRPASFHALIGKDGTIYQTIPFNTGSWHVGRPGRIDGRLFANINRATIGIELLNAGKLQKVGDAFYADPFTVGAAYLVTADRAVAVGDEWYDGFPDPQEQAASRLLQALIIRFAWDRSVCRYSHADFDYPRKIDPGPLFRGTILPRILDRCFGTADVPLALPWPPVPQ